jgi:hypothetical protein
MQYVDPKVDSEDDLDHRKPCSYVTRSIVLLQDNAIQRERESEMCRHMCMVVAHNQSALCSGLVNATRANLSQCLLSRISPSRLRAIPGDPSSKAQTVESNRPVFDFCTAELSV